MFTHSLRDNSPSLHDSHAFRFVPVTSYSDTPTPTSPALDERSRVQRGRLFTTRAERHAAADLPAPPLLNAEATFAGRPLPPISAFLLEGHEQAGGSRYCARRRRNRRKVLKRLLFCSRFSLVRSRSPPPTSEPTRGINAAETGESDEAGASS